MMNEQITDEARKLLRNAVHVYGGELIPGENEDRAVAVIAAKLSENQSLKLELAVAKESLALTEEAFLTMKNRLKELASLLHSNYQGMGH